MALAINIILSKHGEIMKTVASERYGYFLFTQGLYYSLSGYLFRPVIPILKSFFIQKKIKNKISCFIFLFFIFLPFFLRKKIYILMRRKNYRYKVYN